MWLSNNNYQTLNCVYELDIGLNARYHLVNILTFVIYYKMAYVVNLMSTLSENQLHEHKCLINKLVNKSTFKSENICVLVAMVL